jgi:hypothetical protein
MNQRLVAAVNRDAKRINFQPGKREQLVNRYALITDAAA